MKPSAPQDAQVKSYSRVQYPRVCHGRIEGRRYRAHSLIRPSTALDNSVASGPNDAIDRMDFFLRSLEVLPVFDRRCLRQRRVDFRADFDEIRGKEATR